MPSYLSWSGCTVKSSYPYLFLVFTQALFKLSIPSCNPVKNVKIADFQYRNLTELVLISTESLSFRKILGILLEIRLVLHYRYILVKLG